jgi:hypothetical protein
MNTIMQPQIFILAWSFCTKSIAVIGFGPKKVHLELRYNISFYYIMDMYVFPKGNYQKNCKTIILENLISF